MSSLTPLFDNILLKKVAAADRSAGGLFLPSLAADNQKLPQAEVVSVGAGRYVDGVFVEPIVEVGDIVVYKKLMADEIQHDGVDFLIITEGAVLAIIR